MPARLRLNVILFSALVLASPAFARGQAPQRTATTTTNAPVLDSPNADQTPLRVAREGSVLLLLEVNGDWCHVEFQDPDYGRRTGYIQTKYVRLDQPRAIQTPPASDRGRMPPTRSPMPPVADATISSRKSFSSKFFLGAGYEGNGVVLTEPGIPSSTDSGRGFGVTLGYGFNPHWSLYGTLSGAGMNSEDGSAYTLGHIDLGARVHFLAGRSRAVPFIEAGISGRSGSGDFLYGYSVHSLTMTGIGPAFGGGVNVHFTPAVAFSTGVAWSVGDFTDYKIDNVNLPGAPSISAVSARVHFGLVWFAKAPKS